MRQLNPAASIRSMMVGTHGTGDGLYGPLPSMAGTQLGSFDTGSHWVARQSASFWLSHPQPEWVSPPSGFLVRPNPSRSEDASSR